MNNKDNITIEFKNMDIGLLNCKKNIEEFLYHANNVSNKIPKIYNFNPVKKKAWIQEHVSIKYNKNTRIHPIFLLLLHRTPGKHTYEDGWKEIDKIKEEPDFVSSDGVEWKNIDNIYPHYENKGFISMKIFSAKDKDDVSKNVLELLDAFFVFQKQKNNSDITEDMLGIIKWSFLEIITNSYIHAFRTERNHVALSLYVDKKTKQIYFLIADNGITIPTSVLNKKKLKNNKKAFIWAMTKYNTTKDEGENGGKGLYDVKNIINKSKGELLIWSNDIIFTSYNNNESIQKSFFKYNGTIVYGSVSINDIIQDINLLNKKSVREKGEVFFDDTRTK